MGFQASPQFGSKEKLENKIEKTSILIIDYFHWQIFVVYFGEWLVTQQKLTDTYILLHIRPVSKEPLYILFLPPEVCFPIPSILIWLAHTCPSSLSSKSPSLKHLWFMSPGPQVELLNAPAYPLLLYKTFSLSEQTFPHSGDYVILLSQCLTQRLIKCSPNEWRQNIKQPWVSFSTSCTIPFSPGSFIHHPCRHLVSEKHIRKGQDWLSLSTLCFSYLKIFNPS